MQVRLGGIVLPIRRFFTPEKLMVRFLASWCGAALISLFWVPYDFHKIDFVKQIPLFPFIGCIGAVFLLLSLLAILVPSGKTDNYGMFFLVYAYALILTAQKQDTWFGLGILIVLTFVGYYLLKEDKLGLLHLPLSSGAVYGILAGCAAVYILYTGGLTSLRYTTYSSSTYDLGIFSQMFYWMKETGLPMTTCERNNLVSHFAIHISPIYYVLLPFYALFPSPVTLQISQAVILASGVIPVILLCRHMNLGNRSTLMIGFVYCFFPALTGGCFYDIHENLFLTPLLLWLFYFYEKKKWPLFWVFVLLVFSVKEDAAIYIACIGLYLLICRKEWIRGPILFLGAVGYFLGAYAYLQSQEYGSLLSSRFNSLMTDPSGGPFNIVRTLLLDPGYMFSMVFKDEKLLYLITMLLPVACIPLFNKRLSQLVLLLPFLVINLLSDYPYHYNLYFQYGFAAVALFFYLTVRNIAVFDVSKRQKILPFAVIATTVLFLSTMSNQTFYLQRAIENQEVNQKLDSYLESIPEDASVTASGYFTPKLSKRRILYHYPANHQTEYVVLDLRSTREPGGEPAIAELEKQGYVRISYEEDLIAILQNTNYADSEQF